MNAKELHNLLSNANTNVDAEMIAMIKASDAEGRYTSDIAALESMVELQEVIGTDSATLLRLARKVVGKIAFASSLQQNDEYAIVKRFINLAIDVYLGHNADKATSLKRMYSEMASAGMDIKPYVSLANDVVVLVKKLKGQE